MTKSSLECVLCESGCAGTVYPITNAKQEYALENPDDLDVLLGWTLLGLPDLIIN